MRPCGRGNFNLPGASPRDLEFDLRSGRSPDRRIGTPLAAEQARVRRRSAERRRDVTMMADVCGTELLDRLAELADPDPPRADDAPISQADPHIEAIFNKMRADPEIEVGFRRRR
jgi:hypothetical protein